MKKSIKYIKFTRIPLAIFFLAILFIIIYNIAFVGRIFPNTSVAGVNLGGQKESEAKKLLSETFFPPDKITLIYNDEKFEINPESFDFSYDYQETAKRAYGLDRTGKTLFYPRSIGLAIRINEDKLDSIISDIAGQISEEPISPSVKLIKGEVVVDPGKSGVVVDQKSLREKIGEFLSKNQLSPIPIPTANIDITLTRKGVEDLSQRAKGLIGKTLTITFEFQVFSYKGNELFGLLGVEGGFDDHKINTVAETIAKTIDRLPQNPVFVFSDGKVNEFAPAKEGITTKKEELAAKILESLARYESEEVKEISLQLPVIKTSSEIQTEDINNLGIKELIGRGTSRFRGSIPSRVFNIGLAASRINGSLIAPGETFSFNDALGDVSKFTGYKEAFIIKDGKTILGDGGGVCQVSTTLFRAALNAGLPINERRAHAYRVSYYEQDSPPGLDATVYSPTTDLKIVNNTPGHVLIQAKSDPKLATLVFELYGTDDGRAATTTKPKVSDVVSAPEDLYQDDPTLPAGKIKQIDFKANGAKVIFDYKVERDGKNIYSKKFVSNYRPWQAVYLRGTGPAQ